MNKPPPRRFQPRGLEILHEDRHIIVANKSPGLLTIATENDRIRTAYHLLTDYVRRGMEKSRERVFIVHRLDRDTSGVLVFARTEAAKRQLQDHWDETEKHYLAVIHGVMEKKEGTIVSYLTENAAFRVYSTRNPAQGLLSSTAYRVIGEMPGFSVLDVTLLTGRKHQIRVHFSDQGHPVVGDSKYGKPRDPHKFLALHALTLALNHPVTGQRMVFEAAPPPHFHRWWRRSSHPGNSLPPA